MHSEPCEEKRREGRIETDFLSACSTDLVSFGQTNEESRVFCKRSVFLRMFLILVPSPSEKARGPHSSTLTWKIPWTEEPGGLQSMGSLRVGHDGATSLSLFPFMHWRSGNPLQCSCLENPRDGGAWWAAIYGVAQSRT